MRHERNCHASECRYYFGTAPEASEILIVSVTKEQQAEELSVGCKNKWDGNRRKKKGYLLLASSFTPVIRVIEYGGRVDLYRCLKVWKVCPPAPGGFRDQHKLKLGTNAIRETKETLRQTPLRPT